MKKAKYLALLLMAALAAALLCACGPSEGERVAELAGAWIAEYPADEEDVQDLLESNSFYEEEIALVDFSALNYVERLEFTTDKTYSIILPADLFRENVRDFFEMAFDDLYEGRSSLEEVYGITFSDMTRDEFRQFYAGLYDQADYETLLDALTDAAYSYDSMGELESGTFKVRGDVLDFTAPTEEDSGYADYELSGDSLTIHYSNGDLVYTRAD